MVIVESTHKFVDRLNSLRKEDGETVNRYMRIFCAEVEKMPYGASLPSISLSNFEIYLSKGSPLDLEIDIQNGTDILYDVFFEDFYLLVALIGKQPQKCYLLSISKKKPLK